jgi:hypothetical protein
MRHILSEAGVSTDPAKIAAIREMPVPRHVKEFRSFLGMANYYRRFIKDFAELTEPLTALTMKGATVKIIEKTRENSKG